MSTVEEINARSVKYERDDALALLDGMSELYVAKGKKVVHFNLKKERPDDDEIASLILGRSGTLRAPVLRIGRKLIVGFNEEAIGLVLK